MTLGPFSSFGKVFSLVLPEERQRSAYVVAGENNYPHPLSEPVGMLTNASQSNYGKPRDKLHCTHCGKTNHTIDKCFQLHGFPPGFGRGRGRPPENNGSVSRSIHNVSNDDVYSDLGTAPVSLTADQCS